MKDWNDAHRAGVNIVALAGQLRDIEPNGAIERLAAVLSLDVRPTLSPSRLTGFGRGALHAASSPSSVEIPRKARAKSMSTSPQQFQRGASGPTMKGRLRSGAC